MSKLSGKALADRARDLNIAGRSKMSADELRDAVTARQAEIDAAHAELPTTEESETEETHVVPNRAEVRKRRRNLGRLRNDGTPHGGHTPTFNRASRLDASVRAGERGKFYGNRNPDALRSSGPRDVPVNVVHVGH